MKKHKQFSAFFLPLLLIITAHFLYREIYDLSYQEIILDENKENNRGSAKYLWYTLSLQSKTDIFDKEIISKNS